MSFKYPSKKWLNIRDEVGEEIKRILLEKGGQEDPQVTGQNERWRVRLHDAVFTFYKSGTLFCTPTSDVRVLEVWSRVDGLIPSAFVTPSKEFLIGFDETGKGEIFGHTVLTGVIFPREQFSEIEKLVGVADTKKKRTMAYWDEVFSRLDAMRPKLKTHVEKIPPWHVDKFNLNRILDVVYQRILSNFIREIDFSKSRIVIDNYGVGHALREFLDSLSKAGAEVIVTHKADSRFLEAKVASLVSKREREKVIEVINK